MGSLLCVLLKKKWKQHLENILLPLRWRHNERDGVSNHQLHDCLRNRLFERRSKETSQLCVTGLCAGNSPVTGEFPAQRASDAENVSICWRHHDTFVPAVVAFVCGVAALVILAGAVAFVVALRKRHRKKHTDSASEVSGFGIIELFTVTSHECHGVSNHRQLGCLSNGLLDWYWPLVRGIYRWSVDCEGNLPVTSGFPSHKGPVTRKVYPYHDVTMSRQRFTLYHESICTMLLCSFCLRRS